MRQKCLAAADHGGYPAPPPRRPDGVLQTGKDNNVVSPARPDKNVWREALQNAESAADPARIFATATVPIHGIDREICRGGFAMPLRPLLRSSFMMFLLLCVLVVAQTPVRLLLQGFASTTIETVERADEATAPQTAGASAAASGAPVVHELSVRVGHVTIVNFSARSVLRI